MPTLHHQMFYISPVLCCFRECAKMRTFESKSVICLVCLTCYTLGALHLFTALVTIHHMLSVPEALGNCHSFCGFNYMYGRSTRVYSNIGMSYGYFIRFLHLFHMSFTFLCNVPNVISVLSRHLFHSVFFQCTFPVCVYSVIILMLMSKRMSCLQTSELCDNYLQRSSLC